MVEALSNLGYWVQVSAALYQIRMNGIQLPCQGLLALFGYCEGEASAYKATLILVYISLSLHPLTKVFAIMYQAWKILAIQH